MQLHNLITFIFVYNILALVDAMFFWEPRATKKQTTKKRIRGYTLQNNKCIPCPTGYTGTTCKEPCQYPKYGLGCQSNCDCNPQLCHHIKGCPPARLTCEVGRSGKYCEIPCRFPSYGQGCQERCSCLQHLCNAETGCKNKISTEGKPNIVLTHVHIKPTVSSTFMPRRSFMENHLSTSNDRTDGVEKSTSSDVSINVSKARGKTDFPMHGYWTQRKVMLWFIIGLVVIISLLILLHVRIQIALCNKEKKKYIHSELVR